MQFPTLSDDLGVLLPLRIKLTQDVVAQYDTKKERNIFSGSYRTLPFTLPKGTELTLIGKLKNGSLFFTDKTNDGFPVDVFFDKIVGKADVISTPKPPKPVKEDKLKVGSSAKENPKDESSDKILGMPKMVFYVGVSALVLIGGFFAYKKFKK